MKKLLVCMFIAVSIFSLGCAGTGGDRPPRWSSADVDQVAG